MKGYSIINPCFIRFWENKITFKNATQFPLLFPQMNQSDLFQKHEEKNFFQTKDPKMTRMTIFKKSNIFIYNMV